MASLHNVSPKVKTLVDRLTGIDKGPDGERVQYEDPSDILERITGRLKESRLFELAAKLEQLDRIIRHHGLNDERRQWLADALSKVPATLLAGEGEPVTEEVPPAMLFSVDDDEVLAGQIQANPALFGESRHTVDGDQCDSTERGIGSVEAGDLHTLIERLAEHGLAVPGSATRENFCDLLMTACLTKRALDLQARQGDRQAKAPAPRPDPQKKKTQQPGQGLPNPLQFSVKEMSDERAEEIAAAMTGGSSFEVDDE